MTVWRKGMKAVCVDDSPVGGRNLCNLKIGSVYTVKDILTNYTARRIGGNIATGTTLVLAGVDNPFAEISNGFAAERFRPAAERKTDISSLEALLQNPHVKIEETV